MSCNGYLTIAPRNSFSATYMKCLGVALFTLIQFNVKGRGGGGGGGGQAFHFRKKDFKLGVGGEGQDTSRHFEGSFRCNTVYVQYCPCEASEQKLGQKRKS